MENKRYEHVQYVDLKNDGSLHECIIMKYTDAGDLYYIPVEHLDDIDVARLHQIISRKDADRYELWDLLSNVTLKNGSNALTFFQQFVLHRTANGKIQPPGRVISAKPRTIVKRSDMEQTKRGPGRPPKAQ